ncbi:FAD:protein FMN transferase [Microlunatus flavus]|uniref:FAD:protein FMN transferase n=1 Tax=Microlunatus flavus TaxID=1036181 RepID=A0A1H9K9A3_9ACTN|nr:FAD:protein FMN transferase [Microlunatus flavus]SEQ95730.1 thiamine biosynthesis lipoprotein [Microlunatus flavus]
MPTTAAPELRRYVAHVMGMPISLALRGDHADDEHARRAWAAVMDELAEVDRVFSTYRPDSVVSRLGRGELDLADAPVEVHEVLALARRAERESGGAFSVDLPVGPTSPGVRRFDPSGVVKGWAADRASRHLAALAGTDFCLSAGGDVVCRSARQPWRIGIEDPHDPARVVAVVPLRRGAIATSGTAHRGAHLVDARTGLAPEGVASVTVFGPSLTWADIDATAAYALGTGAAAWLRTRPVDSALVVAPDGTITTVVPTA